MGSGDGPSSSNSSTVFADSFRMRSLRICCVCFFNPCLDCSPYLILRSPINSFCLLTCRDLLYFHRNRIDGGPLALAYWALCGILSGLLRNNTMDARFTLLGPYWRVPIPRCDLLLPVLIRSSEHTRWLLLVPAGFLVPVIVRTFVIPPLVPILPMLSARSIEAAMFVCWRVILIASTPFSIFGVAPIVFILWLVFLRIVVIPAIPIVLVITWIAIHIPWSVFLPPLLITAWGTLCVHAAYYGRGSVQHIVLALLNCVSFRVTDWTVDSHFAFHCGMPRIQANHAEDRLTKNVVPRPEVTLVVMRTWKTFPLLRPARAVALFL